MIGFCATVAAVSCWPSQPFSLPLVMAAQCGAVAVLASRLRGGLPAGALCGLALALSHGHALLAHRLPESCVGTPLEVTGTVTSLVQRDQLWDGTPRQRFQFQVIAMAAEHCTGPRRLSLSYSGTTAIEPGRGYRFTARLRRPWGNANPGSPNLQAWFARNRIDAVGYVPRRLAATPLEQGPATLRVTRLRQRLSAAIDAVPVTAQARGILRAVSVADRSGVDTDLWRLFQIGGVNHLLVVSGLHVSLIGGIGYLLGTLAGRLLPAHSILPVTGPLLALALAAGYAALAGFSLPTQRALCMLGVLAVAALAGRVGNVVNTLLLATTVVFALDPLAVTGSGFWLSFGAVAALLWLSRCQLSRCRQSAQRLRRTLGTQGYMTLVMLPLGAWFFGGTSVVAVAVNLLLIPLVGLFVVPLALLAALCWMLSLPVDVHLWRFAALPLDRLLPVASMFATEHAGWLYRELRGNWHAVLPAAAGAVLLALPGRRGLRLLALLLCLPALLPQAPGHAGDSLQTRVSVIDVGQGTAVLIRSGGRALLYDTGGGHPLAWNAGTAIVLPFLKARGVTALDTLVVSHGDLDHSAGALAVATRFPVARLRYGDRVPGLEGGLPCRAGEAWRWPGGQRFQFLSPVTGESAGGNDGSCVLQASVGDLRLLLPGDIGERRERELVSHWRDGLRSDWLLVGHHGSRTSSSGVLLKTVRPDIAVVSSGYANSFGHPHPTVLARLTGHGVRLFATARDGAVEFSIGSAGAVGVRRFRHAWRPYWM